MISTNYGKARETMPTLDATRHIEAARARRGAENWGSCWRIGEHCTPAAIVAMAATQPGRANAPNN